MRSAGRESGPRRSPRWRRAVVPLCEASGGASARRGDPHQVRGDDDRDPRRQQQHHHHPRDLHPSHPVRRGPASGSGGAMKGKERSPVKPKRSRGGGGGGGEDSSSSRGERSKKLGGSGGSNGSSSGGGGKSGESSRRSLHLDKSRSSSRGGSREYDTGSSRSLHAYSSPSTAKNSSGGGGGESRSSSRGRGGGGGGESRSSGAAGSSSSSSALDGGGGGGGEYKTLKISELGSQLSDEAVEDGLFHEFKRFGDVSVKISHLAGSGSGPGGDEQRVAFVNFRRAEDARAAKHARGRLVLYDRPLKIEAVYASRRRSRSPLDKDAYGLSSGLAGMSVSGHRHAPGGGGGGGQRSLSPGGAALGYRDYRLQQLALGRLPPPPPPPLPRELDRDRDYQFYDRVRPAYSLEPRVGAGGGGAAPFRDVDEIAPEDDQRANRTLFLGNLDITVTESDLRRAFDRFGVITEVDIKRPSRGQTSTYGFLKFENLDMSHRAKLAMSGKIIVRNPIKIGYGKATPTTRLWVGGLGPWVPLAALAREFDRFGTIRTIDYRKGDSWAYIQYESLDAAHAAWTHMRGFPLGGPDRRLRVDFADTEHRYQQQYLQPLPLAHYDLVTDAFGHRAPDPLRGARDRTPPLLYRDRDRDRDRDLYPDSDWAPPPPPVRERERGARTAASSAVPAYEPLDSLDRRRDGWSLDRDRGDRDLPGSRDQPRKRRLADDGGGRHLDRSPDGDRPRKRHCAPSPDRSPEPGGARDRYNSDNDRCSSRLLLDRERPSPARDRRGSLEKSQGDKRDRKNSASAERDRKHRTAAPTDGKSPLKKEDRADGSSASASASAASSKLKSPAQKQESGAAASASAAAAAAAASASPKLCLAWQGMLLLKNSNFPSNMHLLQGDLQVASSLLVEGATGGKVAQLKITQRLRLDQPKLDEVTRRIKVAGPNGYAILLAVPGSSDSRSSSSAASDTATSTQRPLRNLVSYLKQKQAAGVISLPVGGNKDKENTGVLHAFPPCEFSQQFLDSPAKALAKSEDDYLVMIIVRGFSFFTLSFKNNSSKLQTQILEQSEFGGKSPLTRKMVMYTSNGLLGVW